MQAKKRVSSQSIIGQQGANLIERIVLDMKYVWRQLLIFDLGIDGEIEICDPATGEATNAILRVQAKATTQAFQAETNSSFEYTCDERDLDYWLRGNTPVILIVCRPSSNEAYWVSIKDYFNDLASRKSKKVRFDKLLNCFDASSATSLMTLALPKDSGLYAAPLPVEDTLYTNLLKVTSIAPTIWVAATDHRDPKNVWRELKRRDDTFGPEWVLKNKQFMSFHDLSEFPFSELCDVGTVESFDTSEWADAEDIDKRNDFVRLLNLCLSQRTRQLGLSYDKMREYFYFPATQNLRPRKIGYKSLKRSVSREVFRQYIKKDDSGQTAYCRHAAFRGQFLRLDSTWCFEITPTYHFTWDGVREDKFRAERLKGIKRLERNPAVLGQLLMWAHFLANTLDDMFDSEYPFLSFGELETVNVVGTLPDTVWYNAEDSKHAKTINHPDNQLTLLGL